MSKPLSRKLDSKTFIIAAITIGGALEWYEIGLFISWPLLVQNQAAGFDISVAESVNASAMIILVAFTLANGSARAIGGFFFGKKGDKKGRSVAFPLTLLFATLPSWSLAILSFFISYEYWLEYSTVIFAIVKFFQGMPAGGELPGAICYLSETASRYHQRSSWLSRRYMCSYALVGPQVGLGLSAIVCLALKELFPIEVLVASAWKYVFVFSGLIGIIGFLMRKKIHETSEFMELRVHHRVIHKPLKILFKKYLSRVFLAGLASVFEIVTFAVLSIVPYYFSRETFSLGEKTIFFITLLFSGLCAALLPLIGYFSSKYYYFPWLLCSVLGIMLTSPALYYFLVSGNFIASIILLVIATIFLSIQASILPSILAEIFPVQVKYTGIAFSFNICDGILWSAITGFCAMYFNVYRPDFLWIMPAARLTFLLAIWLGRSSKILKSRVK
jgi:MHS family proline/betaine transporter-like MFS transporter